MSRKHQLLSNDICIGRVLKCSKISDNRTSTLARLRLSTYGPIDLIFPLEDWYSLPFICSLARDRGRILVVEIFYSHSFMLVSRPRRPRVEDAAPICEDLLR